MKGTVLVTGGAGFIGSHLVDHLLDLGYQVRVLDNLVPQVHAGNEKDESGWPIYLNAECERVRGDVRDISVVERSLIGVSYVIHLAASVGVGQSMSRILDYTSTNVLGAATLLEAIYQRPFRNNVQRMVVASSMSIYGEGQYITFNGDAVAPELRPLEQMRRHKWDVIHNGEVVKPIPTREDKSLNPSSVYALNKRDHEDMFLIIGDALGIPTTALRLFNTYGTRQSLSNPYTGVVAIFASRLLNGKAPQLFEDGRQRRDFVHVSDVVRAFGLALEHGSKTSCFNVGSGHSMDLLDVASELTHVMGNDISPEILHKFRVGDIRNCFADITRIQNEFGYVPKVNFSDGIEELVEWVERQTSTDMTQSSMAELKEYGLVY